MKKKTGASAVSIGIAVSLCVFIFGGLGLAVYNYMKTDRSLLASEGDKLSEKDFTPIQHQYIPGLNMPLTRSDNWHQIASEPLLEHKDFAGIDGSTATLPITAELARQFFGVADEEIFGKYAMHNKTDVAYDNLIHKNTNRITLSKSDDPNDFFDDSDDALEKEVHLIFATPPSEDEIATAKENGVSLDAKAVALDGLKPKLFKVHLILFVLLGIYEYVCVIASSIKLYGGYAAIGYIFLGVVLWIINLIIFAIAYNFIKTIIRQKEIQDENEYDADDTAH